MGADESKYPPAAEGFLIGGPSKGACLEALHAGSSQSPRAVGAV
jgi:hypothetical protein